MIFFFSLEIYFSLFLVLNFLFFFKKFFSFNFFKNFTPMSSNVSIPKKFNVPSSNINIASTSSYANKFSDVCMKVYGNIVKFFYFLYSLIGRFFSKYYLSTSVLGCIFFIIGCIYLIYQFNKRTDFFHKLKKSLTFSDDTQIGKVQNYFINHFNEYVVFSALYVSGMFCKYVGKIVDEIFFKNFRAGFYNYAEKIADVFNIDVSSENSNDSRTFGKTFATFLQIFFVFCVMIAIIIFILFIFNICCEVNSSFKITTVFMYSCGQAIEGLLKFLRQVFLSIQFTFK